MEEEIGANGTPCGRYKARTLMKMAGVYAKQKRKMLADHRMISSMRLKGNCWDNAVAESFYAA
jgi:transposase InsO family protein